MSLVFDNAAPLVPGEPERADVACFIGFVARRRERPLPAAVRAQLRDAGWVDGPWRKGDAAIESLDNLPVVIDSWALFDQLFAWEQRPVGRAADPVTGALPRCASYLGAAVRSFFARGGRRCVVLRVGDPWAFLESTSNRSARRRARLSRLVPGFDTTLPPFDPTDPRGWRGIEHLAGLGQVSLVCLPDLPDACSSEPWLPATGLPVAPEPEGFVECSATELPLPEDRGLRGLLAPRLDSQGFGPWRVAVAAVRAFLAQHQREALLVAALPLPREDARRPGARGGVHAMADLVGFLRRSGVLETEGQHTAGTLTVASAFVQLGYPWLRTRDASDLPEGIEPPDGALAGLIAHGALMRGTHASVAGDHSSALLRDVTGSVPEASWGAGVDAPAQILARRLCLFAAQPGGWALQSDVTTSADEAWRPGGVSRLMASLLRAARRRGLAVAFDSNGPTTWLALRRALEHLLTGFWRAGALAGVRPDDAFSVRCDRNTMTQNDLDRGRLVAEISVRPAASIERITVVLQLTNAAAPQALLKEVA